MNQCRNYLGHAVTYFLMLGVNFSCVYCPVLFLIVSNSCTGCQSLLD